MSKPSRVTQPIVGAPSRTATAVKPLSIGIPRDAGPPHAGLLALARALGRQAATQMQARSGSDGPGIVEVACSSILALLLITAAVLAWQTELTRTTARRSPRSAPHGDAGERRLELEAELATAVAPAPRLHPNLPVLSRERVAELRQALQEEGGAAATDAVRALIEEVRLVPESGTLQIENRGELSTILGLGARATSTGRSKQAEAHVLGVQVKMVAGTGFEPVTFRL